MKFPRDMSDKEYYLQNPETKKIAMDMIAFNAKCIVRLHELSYDH